MAADVQDLPDSLQNLLKVVVGQPWPEGNVGQLRQLGRAWQAYHDEIQHLADGLKHIGDALDRAMNGAAAEAWAAHFRTDFPRNLESLLEITQQFADGALNAAADIDEARIMIVVQLVILAVAIASLLSTIFGAVFVPSVIAVARFAIQVLIHLLWEALLEIALGFFVPLIINAWQKYVDGTRTHIDWGRQWKNLGGSVIGGVTAGLGRGFASFVASTAAKNVFGSQLRFTFDHAGRGIWAEGSGFKTFYGLNNAVWQGLGGVAAASADMRISGGDWNWGTVTATALPGVADRDTPHGSGIKDSGDLGTKDLPKLTPFSSLGDEPTPPPYSKAIDPAVVASGADGKFLPGSVEPAPAEALASSGPYDRLALADIDEEPLPAYSPFDPNSHQDVAGQDPSQPLVDTTRAAASPATDGTWAPLTGTTPASSPYVGSAAGGGTGSAGAPGSNGSPPSVAPVVAQAMAASGHTARSLATATGVPATAITDLLTGTARPLSVTEATRLADGLGLSGADKATFVAATTTDATTAADGPGHTQASANATGVTGQPGPGERVATAAGAQPATATTNTTTTTTTTTTATTTTTTTATGDPTTSAGTPTETPGGSPVTSTAETGGHSSYAHVRPAETAVDALTQPTVTTPADVAAADSPERTLSGHGSSASTDERHPSQGMAPTASPSGGGAQSSALPQPSTSPASSTTPQPSTGSPSATAPQPLGTSPSAATPQPLATSPSSTTPQPAAGPQSLAAPTQFVGWTEQTVQIGGVDGGPPVSVHALVRPDQQEMVSNWADGQPTYWQRSAAGDWRPAPARSDPPPSAPGSPTRADRSPAGVPAAPVSLGEHLRGDLALPSTVSEPAPEGTPNSAETGGPVAQPATFAEGPGPASGDTSARADAPAAHHDPPGLVAMVGAAPPPEVRRSSSVGEQATGAPVHSVASSTVAGEGEPSASSADEPSTREPETSGTPDPESSQVIVEAALLKLAERDHIGFAFDYLSTVDPAKRRELLKSPVSRADAQELRTLANLATGTATLNSELADVNLIRALANALETPPIVRDQHATVDWVAVARQLGVSTNLVPRFLTDSKRVEWVRIQLESMKANPDRATNIRALGVAVATC